MKKICVYCGSSPGSRPEYTSAARTLGAELVRRNIGLVYGGASVGLMCEIADSVLELGGEVMGIMPQSLVDKEVSHPDLTEFRVVTSMHERKALMADVSDGFIALPGGLGTIEELFEVLTWSQLGFHKKPCALVNVKGYFEHLALFLDHTADQEFMKPIHRDMLLMETTPAAVLDLMEDYTPPAVDKWIERGQT